jgi:hypothetical protein
VCGPFVEGNAVAESTLDQERTRRHQVSRFDVVERVSEVEFIHLVLDDSRAALRHSPVV